MNFSSMDYFIMAARERNITRAAERLHITQQSLSAHIAAMERELGSKLFIRRVPLELTYAGEIFLQYALDIQRKLTSMEQEFNDITENQKGVLRIGVSITRGRAIMPLLIERFRNLYPQVEICLSEDSNSALLEALENGETDLIIANFPDMLPRLELADFYEEEIVLILARSLWEQMEEKQRQEGKPPLSVEALSNGDLSALRGCPFLMNPKQDIAGRVGYGLLSQSGILPRPAVVSSSIETLLALCIRGVGACFCPENLMRMIFPPEQTADLKVIRFQDGARYRIRFGYLKQAYHWTVLRDFIEMGQAMALEF